MITLTYKGKLCSVNNRYYRNFSLKKQYKEFKECLSWEAKIQMQGKYAFKCPIRCEIYILYKGRNPDIDNYLKPILDSMNGIVYEDDKQIERLIVYKSKSNYQGVVIKIDPI